jgi:hypothetical protein
MADATPQDDKQAIDIEKLDDVSGGATGLKSSMITTGVHEDVVSGASHDITTGHTSDIVVGKLP